MTRPRAHRSAVVSAALVAVLTSLAIVASSTPAVALLPHSRPQHSRPVRFSPLARQSAVVASRATTGPDDIPGPPPLDCPVIVRCLWDSAGDTNFDDASRPYDFRIRYIVIESTTRTWSHQLAAVRQPGFAAPHFSVRSDGAVAQHLQPLLISRALDNWWFDTHAITITVQRGDDNSFRPYTQQEYEATAALVTHLAREYSVPFDRAHIIGADEVPSGTATGLASLPDDPGPFWDWQTFMSLVGAPIGDPTGSILNVNAGQTFVPGDVVVEESQDPWADGTQILNCSYPNPSSGICDGYPWNFSYVHQAPSRVAPLVSDPGTEPDGAPATMDLHDARARAVDGEQFLVTGVEKGWVGVSWLGGTGWIWNPSTWQNVVLKRGATLLATPKPGAGKVPLYGRAYPERSAYRSSVAYHGVDPLPYRMNAGQHYVVTDTDVPTDLYAPDGSGYPTMNNSVFGQDRYYQLWYGHRIVFVRAADVDLSAHTN